MNIDLYYLPSYSPNLNPIEKMWKVINEHVRNNRYFASPKVFLQQIHHFSRNILPGLAELLSRRINDNFQMLKKMQLQVNRYKSKNQSKGRASVPDSKVPILF